MAESDPNRQLLVDMLQEAAQLEHSLLDSYLYAACSLKSTPQEFAQLSGKPNLRRGIQFERVRRWKQALLTVAHEEMLHLHFVECMLRALGERPYFGLPNRNAKGAWVIPNWQARMGAKAADPEGTEVPISPLTPEYAKSLVMFESSDSLQLEDPFGPQTMKLMTSLHAFEMQLQVEGTVSKVQDPAQAQQLRQSLLELYTTTPAVLEEQPLDLIVQAGLAAPQLPPLEKLHFPSIADFYEKGILPLYEQAFAFGWVTNTNFELLNEQQDPNYGAEGFLPIPIPPRSDHSFQRNKSNTLKPYTAFKHVRDIVEEIVEQGEGVKRFFRRAVAMMEKVEELGGAAQYLAAVNSDLSQIETPDYETPEWLADAQLLRGSHLYQFAMIQVEFAQERELAARSGVQFVPAREPEPLNNSGVLTQLTQELPGQFNACYLVMLAWLSRMYEIKDWAADQRERRPIESLATWPLMSMAIRPMLELASCLPINPVQLFQTGTDALPVLPVLAQQLRVLYEGTERSEKINGRMDYLALRVLTSVAGWAQEQFLSIQEAGLPSGVETLVLDRLRSLMMLSDFEKQFSFRVHGGYSSNQPDEEYQRTHQDREDYVEDPTFFDPQKNHPPLYQDSLVLRMRFCGWGLVQLATDPDPPNDEVGCTGTLMFHPADGNRRFDRALVWQPRDPARDIVREPKDALPPLGVQVVDLTVMAANRGGATAGYVPVSVMSSLGAVQAQGAQMDLRVLNLAPVFRLTPKELLGSSKKLLMNLEEKNGIRPFLNGNNHLTWRDGEPIDPFILSVLEDSGDGLPSLLFQREVFNGKLSLMEMSPIQRAMSMRGPVGFDSVNNLPKWAVSSAMRQMFNQPDYPRSYLSDRANALAACLVQVLREARTQESVDAAVSFAERMYWVSQPKGTTLGWSKATLHYGHTVSGPLSAGQGPNTLLDNLGQRLGLQLGLADGKDRKAADSRWLAHYTLGPMDTDALSHFISGEIFVPLTVVFSGNPLSTSQEWRFPAFLREALAEYALRFDKPFWAPFKVEGNTRTLDVSGMYTLVETLSGPKTGQSYHYTIEGIPGVSDCSGFLGLEPVEGEPGEIKLVWACRFQAEGMGAAVSAFALLANTAQGMSEELSRAFAPR
ncbi:ferritin-like domain-containing protein [Stigmatella hybrida]|uniref:ferritin-like domain-containing protein n=1 Tax=Stigmatella hybrida TaxID=394097 RepID=UPI001CDAEED5|nr:ferritin-like domain-containing protein [Stigmatella hybrida]